jgi:TRAP-type mannitol/chloroaromatic compound transport system permease small subunit
MRRVLNIVDIINEWSGKVFGWLFIPLTFMVVSEVIMRYIFNDPIIGVWDIGGMLQALIIVFGGGYAVLHKGHVSVDILVSRLSARKRAFVDSVTDALVIVAITLLLWKVGANTWFSISCKEHFTSSWGPPIYPLKTAMTIGIGLMLLQAITNWIRNLLRLFSRKGVNIE